MLDFLAPLITYVKYYCYGFFILLLIELIFKLSLIRGIITRFCYGGLELVTLVWVLLAYYGFFIIDDALLGFLMSLNVFFFYWTLYKIYQIMSFHLYPIFYSLKDFKKQYIESFISPPEIKFEPINSDGFSILNLGDNAYNLKYNSWEQEAEFVNIPNDTLVRCHYIIPYNYNNSFKIKEECAKQAKNIEKLKSYNYFSFIMKIFDFTITPGFHYFETIALFPDFYYYYFTNNTSLANFFDSFFVKFIIFLLYPFGLHHFFEFLLFFFSKEVTIEIKKKISFEDNLKCKYGEKDISLQNLQINEEV